MMNQSADILGEYQDASLQSQENSVQTRGNYRQQESGEDGRRQRCRWANPYQQLFFTMLSLGLTWITVANYRSMREECPDSTEHECLSFIKSKLQAWLTLIAINSISSVIQVLLFWYGKGSRVVTVLGVAQIFYLFVNTEHNLNTTKYIGAVNFFHIIIIASLLLVLVLVLLWVKICRRKPVLTIAAYLLIFSLLGVAANSKIKTSCELWETGISGSIENYPGQCKITPPKVCWYYVFNGWFDASYFLRDCHYSSSDRHIFKKYYHKAMESGPFVGLSNPTRFDEEKRRSYEIYKEVFSHAKGFPTLEEARQDPNGFDIIFDSDNQKYLIDVQRNQTLIKQRQKLWREQAESVPLARNVLLIYTDAIGRPSMHFKFPKIVEFFKRRSREQSYDEQKAAEPAEAGDEAYEFYRYNSYLPWTVPNQKRMYWLDDNNFDNVETPIKSVFRQFEKKGYILGASTTLCQVMSMAYFDSYLQTSYFDHELYSFACDPNFQDPQNVDNIVQGPYSIGKHCLYDRIMAEYATDAALSFYRAYKDQPKVFSLQFVEGHEGSGETSLLLIFWLLQNEKRCWRTQQLCFSDHGYHMHGILELINSANVKLQDGLPGMMISLPFGVNRIYRKQIAMNQQAVVSAHNIGHFLYHIAQGQSYPRQNAGLLGTLTSQTCSQLNITEFECKCKYI